MRIKTHWLALVLGLVGVGTVSSVEAQEAAVIPATAAFRDVTVIPMEGERMLPGHTVVVREGRIAAVGPTGSVEIPSDAVVVDGTGRFLLPGLSDMRVQLPAASDPMRVLVVDEFLYFYVANGITTVRAVSGAPYQLELREAIAKGEELAPTLHVGAPALDSEVEVSSLEETIAGYAAAGYDFLTVEPGLPKEAWDRVVAAASASGLPVSGRPPLSVGLDGAIDDGISAVSRLDELFLEATLPEDFPADRSLTERFEGSDEATMDALAQRMATANVFVVPTQYLADHWAGWNQLFGPFEGDSIVELPEYQYVSMEQEDIWVEEGWALATAPGVTPESAHASAVWRRSLMGALHRAGVPILTGTSAPELLSVPAFSLHREVALMVQAGMAPYDVLAATTRNAARYAEAVLGRPGDFGTIAVGNRADLLLLEENPLESLDALRTRVGVMVRGHWLGKEEIQLRLAEIAERYEEFDTD